MNKEKEPLVSVVIPVYNGLRYILRAMESVLKQDVDLELIVVNDASTDETECLVNSFLPDDRIIYLKNETQMGVAASRNRGVSIARGKYIAYLDVDDYWREGKLKKQIAMMEEKGVVLCSSARELMTPGCAPTGYVIESKEDITYKMMLHQNHINCSAVVLLREVALEFPMEKDEIHEDYLTWLRILKKYKRACAVNEPLILYRLSNLGKSGNKLHSAKMTYGVYRQLGLGWIKSLYCFCCYAVCGLIKYHKCGLLKVFPVS